MTDKVLRLITTQEREKRERDAQLADRYCGKDGSAPPPDEKPADEAPIPTDEPPTDEPPPVVTKEDLDYAVSELAKLSTLEAELVLESYAKRLGVPVPALRSEVKKARRFGGAAVNAISERPHWKVEPWPDPVSPKEVLAGIKRRIKQHVFMTDEAVLASVMFAWVHEAAVHSPILLVSSPEPECGKSTLLGLIKYMTPRGETFSDVTAQVLYRMIEKWHPTMLVDEADDAFKSSPQLRGVINSGWTRGTGVPRCNPDTLEPEFFETFIRDHIFKPGKPDRIGSEALVKALINMGDRPWGELPWPYSGKPITQVQLAKLLKPFKVGPKQTRFSGGVTLKGYTAEAFEKAYRYIPAAEPEKEDADT
jgi:hypothetical protein